MNEAAEEWRLRAVAILAGFLRHSSNAAACKATAYEEGQVRIDADRCCGESDDRLQRYCTCASREAHLHALSRPACGSLSRRDRRAQHHRGGRHLLSKRAF